MDKNILNPDERIGIALQLGESHFREFKTAYEGPPESKRHRNIKDICVDIAETLVAFANADGGELLVGVEDDGTVTGVDPSGSKLDVMIAAPRTHIHNETPLPSPRVSKITHDQKLILYFSIPKGTSYVYLTASGRCLQRKDRESVPISSESIHFSRAEVTSREYDRAFVDHADIADLDALLVNEVSQRLSKGMSVEKCLQHLELAEYDGVRFRLRRAALLLFARQSNRWHPRLQVRVLKINGTEMKSGENFNVVVDQEVSNNILTLIESSWDLLRPHLTETRFSKEALFRSQIMYPELACREALVNAIAHRDYSIEGRGIEVRVYTDRLEIISPGGLLSSVNINELRGLTGAHQSRNSMVTRVLREVGYMRELGEGMRRIYELMKSNDLTAPELHADNNVFSVTLHHKYIFSKEQKIWLDSFEKFELSREQKTIVLLGYDGRVVSPKEIWDAVGIVDTDYYRQLLESLRRLGILSRTISKASAITAARKRRIPVKHVPQFTISLPSQAPLLSRAQEVADDTDYAKVYVVNIPYDTNQADLVDLFGRYGDVVDVVIPINRESGHARGFAFIEFERVQEAQKAINQSGRIRIGGRTLYIQRFRSKEELHPH